MLQSSCEVGLKLRPHVGSLSTEGVTNLRRIQKEHETQGSHGLVSFQAVLTIGLGLDQDPEHRLLLMN